MGNAKQDYKSKPDKRDKSRAGGTSLAKVPFTAYRFIRIELTEPEKVEFRELLAGGEFEGDAVTDWVQQGYKFTVNYDHQHSTFLASLSGQYENMLNAGLVLTGRGSSAPVAVAVLEYKDRYLADETGWAACETSRGGSYSDIG